MWCGTLCILLVLCTGFTQAGSKGTEVLVCEWDEESDTPGDCVTKNKTVKAFVGDVTAGTAAKDTSRTHDGLQEAAAKLKEMMASSKTVALVAAEETLTFDLADGLRKSQLFTELSPANVNHVLAAVDLENRKRNLIIFVVADGSKGENNITFSITQLDALVQAMPAGWPETWSFTWCTEKTASAFSLKPTWAYRKAPALLLDTVAAGPMNEKSTFPDLANSTAKAVFQFLVDFKAGITPLVVKSQPASAGTSAAQHPLQGKPSVLVADTFRQFVLDDEDTDALVLFHSPHCPASVSVMPVVDDLVAVLQKASAKVHVYKMDKTVNDVPARGAHLWHYPAMFLYPAHNKTGPPLNYDDFDHSKNHYSREPLLTFLREHGGNAASLPPSAANG